MSSKQIQFNLRSTPTRVGNTAWTTVTGLVSAVHPHASGEYRNACDPEIPLAGPPPREWGIHRHLARRMAKTRSTPTRVGNTARPAKPH